MIRYPILNNSVYCDILYFIGTKENGSYIIELADHLKKKPASLVPQIQYLTEEKFIIFANDYKMKYNKKLYTVNWIRIIEAFHSFIFEKYQQANEIYKADHIKEFYKILKDNKSFKHKLVENKIIDQLIKNIFKEASKHEGILLADIFDVFFDEKVTIHLLSKISGKKNIPNPSFDMKFNLMISKIKDEDFIFLTDLCNLFNHLPLKNIVASDIVYNAINKIEYEIKT